nr:hypothetical protein TDPV-106 [Oriental turtle dovepox virus]
MIYRLEKIVFSIHFLMLFKLKYRLVYILFSIIS